MKALFVLAVTVAGAAAQIGEWCPAVINRGTIKLPFNPAFLHVDDFSSKDEEPELGLTVSSFFNAWPNPNPGPPYTFWERDLVAKVGGIEHKSPEEIDDEDVEVLTDQHLPLGDGTAGAGNTIFAAKTVWPNEAKKVKDGALPFEAMVISQGFHPALKAGRLSLIDLSKTNAHGHYPEYVVHDEGASESNTTTDRFYHNVVFVDMNDDGLDDIVTVRSAFRLVPTFVAPAGELVWFEQPANYDGSQEWTEHVIYGMPFPGTGPDIHLQAADLDGDGIVEIVATHFFTGDPITIPGQPPMPGPNGKIVLYAAPAGALNWDGVGFGPGLTPPQMATLSEDQGLPFDVEFVDLNLDGKLDILATNHQSAEGPAAPTPGRVFALEQPADGKLFESKWPVHVLLDGIRPYANLPDTSPPGRLAPGNAQAFYPDWYLKVWGARPWILVTGDEAGKVWVLKPKRNTAWSYDVATIFDINAHYGEGTSQTPNSNGITISTIGKAAVQERRFGFTQVYVPVFEAKEVIVFSFTSPYNPFPHVSCIKDQ